MAQSVSDYLHIAHADLLDAGAFDAIIDHDSRFYVEPQLLEATKAPELKDGYEKVQTYFGNILRLLHLSKATNDIYWKSAFKQLSFPEVRGTSIGYAQTNAGASIGKYKKNQILSALKQLVDGDVDDPVLLEMLNLFEDGIGCDLISDMVVWILFDDLAIFTNRLFSSFGYTGDYIEVAGPNGKQKLPKNPGANQPILLLPDDILLPLPIAEGMDEVSHSCAYNEGVRKNVSKIITEAFSKITTKDKKERIRKEILSDPAFIKELIRAYKAAKIIPYNLEEDLLGEVIWHQAESGVKSHVGEYKLPKDPTIDDVVGLVDQICTSFKDYIENHREVRNLLYVGDKPRKEKAAQGIFFITADLYCQINNLDVSPETDSGRGPVDFKFSHSYDSRVLGELKLSINQQLVQGYKNQIGEYEKAEKTNRSFFIVVDVKAETIHEQGLAATRMSKLKDEIEARKEKGLEWPKVIFVDAFPKSSASKYQSKPE